MRYHFDKTAVCYGSKNTTHFGMIYFCNHPVYNKCTLFLLGKEKKGLAVIQQRYEPQSKHTWWGEVDAEVADAIYMHEKFQEVLAKRAGPLRNGLFPTVTVRQLMWALKMKPLKKERWETVFDRREI